MHMKLIVSGMVLVSSFQLYGMGSGSRPEKQRVTVHARRVVHSMRDDEKKTLQAPAPSAVQPQETHIQRSPAWGLITLPEAAMPIRTAPAAAPGTIREFMETGWQGTTEAALEQLAVAPMDDIEYTPPTPLVPQEEQPAPGPQGAPVTHVPLQEGPAATDAHFRNLIQRVALDLGLPLPPGLSASTSASGARSSQRATADASSTTSGSASGR